jgi:hypothetical protein
MTELRWARVRTDARCQLRRGAWYRIMWLTPQEAVLDVNSSPVGVSRSLLTMLPTHPLVWSVVPRPHDAGELPANWAPCYAVCPNCKDRARLGSAVNMRCARCGGVFDIGWGDPYFA